MARRDTGQRLGGRRYRAQPRDPITGERRSITAKTRAELEWKVRHFEETRSRYRHGFVDGRQMRMALAPKSADALTVRALYDTYFPTVPEAWKHIAENHWRYRLAPWFADKLATELTEAQLRSWYADLERAISAHGRTYAPKTRRGAYDTLAAMYRLAISAGDLNTFPWGSYRPRVPREPRDRRGAATTPEQLFRIFSAAAERDRQRRELGRYSPLLFSCIVFGLTGARQAELAALAWDCVEIDEPPFRVRFLYQAPKGWNTRDDSPRPTLDTKGRRSREQSLHPSAVAVLRAQREQLRARGWYRIDGPVFPGLGGKWRTSGRVIKPDVFRDVVRLAGFDDWKRWTPHSLRHSNSTIEAWIAARTDGDLRRVADRTGHSDLRVLQGYLHSVSATGGLAQSHVPELPPELAGFAEVQPSRAPAVELAPDGAPVVEIPSATQGAPAELTQLELAHRWLDQGRPGVRPTEVTRTIERAYTRAYQRARYKGLGAAAAREQGARASRAAKGAWGKALARAERERAAGEHPETKGSAGVE